MLNEIQYAWEHGLEHKRESLDIITVHQDKHASEGFRKKVEQIHTKIFNTGIMTRKSPYFCYCITYYDLLHHIGQSRVRWSQIDHLMINNFNSYEGTMLDLIQVLSIFQIRFLTLLGNDWPGITNLFQARGMLRPR
jgi:hypothetical protein